MVRPQKIKNKWKKMAEVVPQLAEPSIPIVDDQGSNPVTVS